MRSKSVGLDWLVLRMEELGFDSFEEVAVHCGLNRGNLYRIFTFETRPSIDVLPKLCHGLRTSPGEILRVLNVQV